MNHSIARQILDEIRKRSLQKVQKGSQKYFRGKTNRHGVELFPEPFLKEIFVCVFPDNACCGLVTPRSGSRTGMIPGEDRLLSVEWFLGTAARGMIPGEERLLSVE